MCKKIGREVTFEELQHCWLGYMKEIPERNLVTLRNLKKQGYRVILLSNTNPYVSAWVDSEAFSGDGHPIGDYFDAMYRSYEVKYMKPDENFFRYVLSQEQIMPEECLFIDDGPVTAAQHLSWVCLLIVRRMEKTGAIRFMSI